MWVLLVVVTTFSSGGAQPPTMMSQEFASQAACEAAQAEVEDFFRARNDYQARITCVAG